MKTKKPGKVGFWQRFFLRQAGKRLRRAIERSQAMSAFPRIMGWLSVLAAVASGLAEMAAVLPPTIAKPVVMLSTLLASFSHSLPTGAAIGLKLPKWFGTLASVLSVAVGFGVAGPLGLWLGVASTVVAAISSNVVGTPTPKPSS